MNWLFLRGLVREQRHWADFPDKFRAVMPEARIHFLDAPGTGTEVDRSSPWTIPGILRDIRSRWRFQRESVEGPWSILSISLGSMVALQWGHEYPEDLSRVVIINTSAAEGTGLFQRLTPAALGDMGRAIIAKTPAEKERAILRMISTTRAEDDRLAEEWGSIAPPASKRLETAARQLFAARRFGLPSPIRVPVLVLASARDRMVKPACSRAIAEKLGAPFLVHPEAGHDLTLDAGSWVAERVRDWMKSPS